MSLEENKILIRKFLEELYDNGNVTVADEVVASPLLRGAMKNAVLLLREVFSDFQFTIEDMISEGDKVVARCLMRGIFTGRLWGVTLSTRSVEVSYIGIYRVDNNQVKA